MRINNFVKFLISQRLNSQMEVKGIQTFLTILIKFLFLTITIG